MRAEIIENLIKEVVGPRRGCLEETLYDPWQEYLSGVIIPSSWKTKNNGAANNPDGEIIKEDIGSSDDDYSSDEIAATTDSELDPRFQTKSFGISFILDSSNPKFDVCATWGMYEENLTNQENNEHEKVKQTWIRKSYGKIVPIDLGFNCDNSKIILYDFEKNGTVYLHIKKVELSDAKSHISIFLVNDLKIKKNQEDYHPNTDSCLFQPSIRINFNQTSSLLNMDPTTSQSSELEFLYREQPVKASGHMCAAIWREIDYNDYFNMDILWPDLKVQLKNDENFKLFEKPDIRSEFIPIYPMPLSSFDIDNLDISLNAEELSENFDPDRLSKKLMTLIECYNEWINENISKKNEINEKNIFENIINNQRIAYTRMINGIETLKSNELARLSFCFANKAISLQNQWSGRSKFNWRPYQVAFFLMNIDSLVNENSSEKDILDLLWIPTGGGKTEAYLAIIAFIISFRRLNSVLSNNNKGGGVSVISRYTLRLLTVQQFRRTLKLITATELLRVHENEDGSIGWRPKECNFDGDWIYGSMRYSAGMWVGGGVSPLHLLDSERGAIPHLKDDNENDASQLIKCPVCGSWLSIPYDGITKEENKIHIVLKSKYKDTNISKKITSLKNKFKEISDSNVTTENHLNNYFTLSLEFEVEMSKHKLNEIFDYLELDFEFGALNKFKLGYFNSLSEIPGKRKKNESYDFEIWCTNPDCDLNNVNWKEGVPYKESNFQFPDGNYERIIESPFTKNKRMPIPGYTIDEHIYYRCPTVIISTADKIARLAFEPRAGSLFGNVNKYHKYYGYYREDLLPKQYAKKVTDEFVEVPQFKSPNLIIQDELHLMDGPLGSLFGLYETMVDAIIKTNGGNPKYIASTATINNADKQSSNLFSKKLFQFPPAGLTINDSFFVKQGNFDDGFDEKNPGRLYAGIYSPGKGPLTPLVRLWSRMLKTSKDFEDDDLVSKYWTLVGYFNAIRELGGAIALYNEDIRVRLKTITKMELDEDINLDEEIDLNIRELNSDNMLELSSRIDSTQLPLILDELERDGKNNKKPDFDAIFTTSMFGTGVDISHLSLMIMVGQPKTTGDYIQATGRIGRDNGGLIITLFKPGKPRDLNHYELFSSYHSRIHLDVEPVSVSPFSKGALEKGLGPSLVAFLRNASNLTVRWFKDDGKTITLKNAQEDLMLIQTLIKNRLKNSGISDEKIDNIIKTFNNNIKKWENLAKQDRELRFSEYNPFHGLKYNVVLGDLAHESEDLEVVYENAPQSLREIEETIGFWV